MMPTGAISTRRGQDRDPERITTREESNIPTFFMKEHSFFHSEVKKEHINSGNKFQCLRFSLMAWLHILAAFALLLDAGVLGVSGESSSSDREGLNIFLF